MFDSLLCKRNRFEYKFVFAIVCWIQIYPIESANSGRGNKNSREAIKAVGPVNEKIDRNYYRKINFCVLTELEYDLYIKQSASVKVKHIYHDIVNTSSKTWKQKWKKVLALKRLKFQAAFSSSENVKRKQIV